MYRNRTANIAIIARSNMVFAASLWLLRSQTTVGDAAYMKAMIPRSRKAGGVTTAPMRSPGARHLAKLTT
jgi:hypothetical protein